MKHFDVIILGAGPGGLFAAREAGRRGLSAVLLEAQDRAGRKLSMAGGGMGNITNRNLSSEHFVSEAPGFCRGPLRRFGTDAALSLLAELRIPWEEREFGQIFCLEPASVLARRMLDAALAVGASFFSGCSVRECLREEGEFRVACGENSFSAPRMLIACGGPACPQAGAGDCGAHLAARLGHRVVPFRPALVPFVMPPDWPLHGLEGISLSAKLSVDTDNGPVFDPCGARSLLFTHRGFSGPAALSASCRWRAGRALTVDFLPEESLLALMHQPENGRQLVRTLLARRMPARLAERLAPPDVAGRRVAELGKKDRERLCSAVHAHRVIPSGTEGMRRAEAAAGGVDVRELGPGMESRFVPGLFFCGEVMDMTGRLGGYNIHWALASAFTAARAMAAQKKTGQCAFSAGNPC